MTLRRSIPMAFNGFFFIRFFALVSALASAVFADDISPTLVASLNRTSFPPGFVFGTGTSSYQVEGAAFEGGKGPNVWDIFTHTYAEKIADRSNGDVAIDQYHRYKEDVAIMKKMNMDAYRFSISWARILPKGKLSGGINSEGIKYYNNLIDELLANGLKPFVTLFHWDSPQALEDEYGGFLNRSIVNDFRNYADLCFKTFGDRVKYWNTFNEPYAFSSGGYARGNWAPGRCSACAFGNSGTEPYIVTHHELLAHAEAVHLYRTKYQAIQKGSIGITLISHWFMPYSDKPSDQNATQRAIDFMFGWLMDPVATGDYPQSMRSLLGSRLPKFSKEEAKGLKGSFDFLGVNYYTSYFVVDAPELINAEPNYFTDSLANQTSVNSKGVSIGPQAASPWLYVHPRGIQELLLYIKRKYNNPTIYVTENGISEFNDPTLSLQEALMDIDRIDYYYHHLFYIQSAIKNGVNIKGYFAWSYADNFEWAAGYTVRFGVVFIDFKNGLQRHKKLTAQWLENLLKK